MIECIKTEAKSWSLGKWIPVTERLPEPETEVLITVRRRCGNGGYHCVITTAFYEDGKVAESDSLWNWSELDGEYNEEEGCWVVSEGWWNFNYFNQGENHNNPVDGYVMAWMPLPEPYRESDEKTGICTMQVIRALDEVEQYHEMEQKRNC